MTDPHPQPKCRVNWDKPIRAGTICNYVDAANNCLQDDINRCPCGGIVRFPIFSATHTPAASASEPGLSKLCFGTITLACEECRACNEIETCTQKQKYLDYDKQQARKDEREQVLNELRYWCFEKAKQYCITDKNGVFANDDPCMQDPFVCMGKKIESLRGGAKDEGGERR